jgi:23S rRNA (pseudouridine1915-N3)-methyltransferase
MRIIAIGKTKQDFILKGIEEYVKRLHTYGSIKWEILPDTKLTKNMTIENVKDREGEQILKNIQSDEFVIALDETGKLYSSVQFAESLQSILPQKKIVFVIGGVYGLAPAIHKRADLLLSFSRFTFTHQMIRVLLMEQLYRAFTIIHGKKYHY